MTVPLRPHLFTPVQIGSIHLKHRVVMAPLRVHDPSNQGTFPAI